MGTQRERIKILREKEGYTAMRFAVAIQDNVDSVRNTESGKKKVTGDMLQSIISVFSVNAYWLLAGEGEMYAKAQDNSSIDSKLIKPQPQEKIVKNHKKASIQAFIDQWFEEESRDDQMWLELQLRRSIPEYKAFVSSKAIVGTSLKKQAEE